MGKVAKVGGLIEFGNWIAIVVGQSLSLVSFIGQFLGVSPLVFVTSSCFSGYPISVGGFWSFALLVGSQNLVIPDFSNHKAGLWLRAVGTKKAFRIGVIIRKEAQERYVQERLVFT